MQMQSPLAVFVPMHLFVVPQDRAVIGATRVWEISRFQYCSKFMALPSDQEVRRAVSRRLHTSSNSSRVSSVRL